MHKYQPKTPLASIGDRLFRALMACALGIGWFVWLWGLRMSALAAGIAMGGLLWLCTRQFCKMYTTKKENLMRQMIGGELAVTNLLMMPTAVALKTVALWIEKKVSFAFERIEKNYAIGKSHGSLTVLILCAQHPSLPINVQQLIDIAREINQKEQVKLLICSTAPFSSEASLWLENTALPIEVIRREELIELAGRYSPATDEQLSQLRRRKKIRRSCGEWLKIILAPSRARRYFWYGIGLTALALTTGQYYYPIPATVCLLLYAGCKLAHSSVFRTGI